MRSLHLLAGILCISCMSPLAASAASVTFNFNSQPFSNVTDGSVIQPEIGTGQSAQINLTYLDPNNPNPSAFQYTDATVYNFTGKVLGAFEGAVNQVQLTFSHPIYRLSFNFSVESGFFDPSNPTAPPPMTDPNAIVATALGPANVPLFNASSPGGAYNPQFGGYSGNLTLNGLLPFTAVLFSLQSQTINNGQDTFVLDDIVADDTPNVPEPGAVALGLALALPAAWRLRKRKSAKSKSA